MVFVRERRVGLDLATIRRCLAVHSRDGHRLLPAPEASRRFGSRPSRRFLFEWVAGVVGGTGLAAGTTGGVVPRECPCLAVPAHRPGGATAATRRPSPRYLCRSAEAAARLGASGKSHSATCGVLRIQRGDDGGPLALGRRCAHDRTARFVCPRYCVAGKRGGFLVADSSSPSCKTEIFVPSQDRLSRLERSADPSAHPHNALCEVSSVRPV